MAQPGQSTGLLIRLSGVRIPLDPPLLVMRHRIRPWILRWPRLRARRTRTESLGSSQTRRSYRGNLTAFVEALPAELFSKYGKPPNQVALMTRRRSSRWPGPIRMWPRRRTPSYSCIRSQDQGWPSGMPRGRDPTYSELNRECQILFTTGILTKQLGARLGTFALPTRTVRA